MTLKSQMITDGDLFEFDSDTWELDPGMGVIYEDDNMVRIGLERRF